MTEGLQEHQTGRFAAPEAFLSGLGVDAAAALVTAAADVVLVMDDRGIIRDVAVGSEELMHHGTQAWVGKAWAETVTVESVPKVEAMLQDAGSGRGVKWRQVNHPWPQGGDLPLSYSVVPVPARAHGQAHHAVAFGRDLRAQAALQQRVVTAQLSMERDYWRLRHVETRYRLLFQAVSDAVLILDAASEKLEEANPAAFALLGESARRPGWSLADALEPASAQAVRDGLARLRGSGRFEPLSVRLRDGGAVRELTASLFRQEGSSQFLVRLVGSHAGAAGTDPPALQLARLVENAPDAFVVTDLAGRVLTANRSFLDLAQLASEDQVRNQMLDRWLGRTGVDLNVLVSNLRQRGVVRLFATRMRGEYGAVAEVEISAVAVTSGDSPCLGFTVRDVGRRIASNDARAGRELPRSPGQMTELIGRVPLKDIVRETTDLIEQLCIEAALELTNDNRASAAEMLGLSRQSLYVKLRRFGIGDSGTDAEPTT